MAPTCVIQHVDAACVGTCITAVTAWSGVDCIHAQLRVIHVIVAHGPDVFRVLGIPRAARFLLSGYVSSFLYYVFGGPLCIAQKGPILGGVVPAVGAVFRLRCWLWSWA